MNHLAAIHVARKQLGLEDDDYRAVLERVTGKSSAGKMTVGEQGKVLDELREEFDYIIAAVVGGTLLTGGYGTALGGALGAMIVAMAVQGIPSSRWNSDWRFLFLGVILLLAMLANRSIRTKAEGMRR